MSSPTPASDDASIEQPSIEKSELKPDYSFKEVATLENTVWRKFDWRILPVAAVFYFLSFLVSKL